MHTPVVGRLAPSPTGALHLGNARSFLLAWLSIRQQNGRLLLRIEDIDSPRVKPWAIQETIDDLLWLGLEWDNSESNRGDYLQTPRIDRYREVFAELRNRGRVYPCVCSRSDVEAAASAPHDTRLPALEGTVYPGTCRGRASSELPEKFAWRWEFQRASAGWHDLRLGDQVAQPAEQLGDFVIAKQVPDFTPAYQLAVVVDDYDSRVTEVIRGDDLICSTFRQTAILDELGWTRPKYCHVPLVVGPDGKRLAKRHGDTRIRQMRELGVRAEAIIGLLAFQLGLTPDRSPLSATSLLNQLPQLDWAELPRGPSVFDLASELPRLRCI